VRKIFTQSIMIVDASAVANLLGMVQSGRLRSYYWSIWQKKSTCMNNKH